MEPIDVELIARVCHEANRAYQIATDEPESPDWDGCGEDMRDSARAGVVAALQGATPEQLHESWMAERTAAGWTLGPVKNGATKEHPCLVPYGDLPEAQRAKDHLFAGIVAALRGDERGNLLADLADAYRRADGIGDARTMLDTLAMRARLLGLTA